MYYVYVLKSLINSRFYIGSTNNLERRIIEHNNGKSKYTKSTRPFQLIHSEIYKTRKEAVRRETALKSGQGRQWLKQKVGRTVASGDRSKVQFLPRPPKYLEMIQKLLKY